MKEVPPIYLRPLESKNIQPASIFCEITDRHCPTLVLSSISWSDTPCPIPPTCLLLSLVSLASPSSSFQDLLTEGSQMARPQGVLSDHFRSLPWHLWHRVISSPPPTTTIQCSPVSPSSQATHFPPPALTVPPPPQPLCCPSPMSSPSACLSVLSHVAWLSAETQPLSFSAIHTAPPCPAAT